MASNFSFRENTYSIAIEVLPIPPIPQRATCRRCGYSREDGVDLSGGSRDLSKSFMIDSLPKKVLFRTGVSIMKQGSFAKRLGVLKLSKIGISCHSFVTEDPAVASFVPEFAAMGW